MHFIEKTAKKLIKNAWRQDKYLHLIWSFWMTAFARVLWTEAEAIFFVMTMGLFKEVWDEKFGSGFSFLDLAANVAGCMLALYFIRLFPEPIFHA